ncbi:ABC transporter ATP-binding protein [Microbacterium sp. CFH 31415]|uniref:ABC transporter ATP-binding protein n=1 Tax=Microbacterium sp. CFH 31415 TaxID=2921732 RepID=UPI001F13B237|nr:ABC transporter ATP-binding protein [Microbacterium sp. CFH 31415]MCH6230868.1 ABC transporter ATP-binding protein [Microbacterium sp. CFH 31415]
MSALALDAQGLVRRYGSVVAVDHADVAVPRGEVVALLGPSGCGKTTTLRLIAGLDRGEGTISIDGVTVSDGAKAVPPEQRGVGLVFQDSVLFPHLDVAANVAYGMKGRNRDAATQRMLELLGIAHLSQRMPHEISGGEQQRTALARTLATEPALVLLDEPFAHLDASLRERVRDEMLAALRRTGTSALLVTHDQSEALAIADRVIVMNAGRIHQQGRPEEVYRRPVDRFTAEFIGRGVLVPARVTAPGVASTALGEVAVGPGASAGECLVVLRPESVELAQPGAGVTGRVVRSLFRGGDRLVRVELADGTQVEASDPAGHAVGGRVAVVVRREVATVPSR